ncbi:MAG: protein kinase [Planctomycetota bacterium]
MSRADETEDPVLEEALAYALESRLLGESVDLEALSGGSSERRAALEQALRTAEMAGSLLSSKPSADPLIGSAVVGRYVISRCIGAGASGAVYEAEDSRLGRSVAIKVLHGWASGSENRFQRFLREGEALATVKHVGVVEIYDRGELSDGRPFLVMELLEGEPFDVVFEQKLPTSEVVRFVRDIAEALHATHEVGIVHRDVKPSNLLKAERGPVVLDFGLARTDDSNISLTKDAILGTPAYMAPEQLRGGSAATVQSDVFGLAATLYHGLTGEAPFPAADASSILAQRLAGRMDPKRLPRSMPRDVVAVVERGMARRLSDRYESMIEFSEELTSILELEPVKARYVPSWQRTGLRVYRDRSVRVGAAVAALLFSALFAFQWIADLRAEEDRLRGERFDQAWRRIEPALGLWTPACRDVEDESHRAQIERTLDESLANRPDYLPARLLRAAFLLDIGRGAQSLEDVRAILPQLSSDLGEELLTSYEQAMKGDGPETGTAPLGVEPASTEDFFTVAFQDLRARDFRRARTLLGGEELIGYGAADELRLLLAVESLPREQKSRVVAAREIQNEVLRLEGRQGRRSAATANVLGAALLAQQRTAEGVRVLRDGLELAPLSANLMINLGVGLRQAGDYKGSVEILDRARSVRPESPTPVQNLFATYQRLAWIGESGAARTAAALTKEPCLGETLQAFLRAEFDFDGALRAISLDEPKEARRRAQAALDGWGAIGFRDEFKDGICRALIGGGDLFLAITRYASLAPQEWWRVLSVAEAMPLIVQGESRVALRSLFRAILEERVDEADLNLFFSQTESQGK